MRPHQRILSGAFMHHSPGKIALICVKFLAKATNAVCVTLRRRGAAQRAALYE